MCTFSVFFGIFFTYDVAFKIINKLEVNNNNLKFNCDFKNHQPARILMNQPITRLAQGIGG